MGIKIDIEKLSSHALMGILLVAINESVDHQDYSEEERIYCNHASLTADLVVLALTDRLKSEGDGRGLLECLLMLQEADLARSTGVFPAVEEKFYSTAKEMGVRLPADLISGPED